MAAAAAAVVAAAAVAEAAEADAGGGAVDGAVDGADAGAVAVGDDGDVAGDDGCRFWRTIWTQRRSKPAESPASDRRQAS